MQRSRTVSWCKAILWLALAAGLLLSGCQSTGSTDSDSFIFLEPTDTLYVDFDMNVDPEIELSLPSVADNMKERRHREYMLEMEQLLLLYELPVEVHLLGKGEKPGNGPVLDLFALRFEQSRFGDIEVTLNAKLQRFGLRNTLGTYSERVPPAISLSDSQHELAFREAIRAPLQQVITELMTHFKTEEEQAMVDEPLGTDLGAE